MSPATLLANANRTRRRIGWLLYALGMLVGGGLLLALFLLPPLLEGDEAALSAMTVGAICALPLLCVYLWVPWIVDRYDPEPLWALMAMLFWGAFAACGFSAAINSFVQAVSAAAGGEQFGEFMGACVSAPLVEEAFKGMALLWMFYFGRRDFDGVVDSIIYATYVALGFAAFENIVYYARAAAADDSGNMLMGTVFVRGVIAPWGHPLYTAMTGIGLGIARETKSGWKRWGAPVIGYFAGVFLHFVWNGAAMLSGSMVLVMLPLWFLLVLAFVILVIWLVARKGRIITENLRDEVLMGNLTQAELQMIGSVTARWKASRHYGGKAGREFVDAAARLALSKWHAERATAGRKMTVSADFVVPLRQQLHTLRAEVSRVLGRPVEQPRAWSAGAPHASAPAAIWNAPGGHGGPRGPQGGYGGPQGGQGGYGGPQGGQGGYGGPQGGQGGYGGPQGGQGGYGGPQGGQGGYGGPQGGQGGYGGPQGGQGGYGGPQGGQGGYGGPQGGQGGYGGPQGGQGGYGGPRGGGHGGQR